MMMQDTYDVGIYCRLSRDDNNGSLESMSIPKLPKMNITNDSYESLVIVKTGQ